jgi:D-proline reductase (dithiol) PrdB
VKPPRTVFVNFPLGHPTGKPFQPELQKSIVKDALNALKTIEAAGTIVTLPYRWTADDNWEQEVAREHLERGRGQG